MGIRVSVTRNVDLAGTTRLMVEMDPGQRTQEVLAWHDMDDIREFFIQTEHIRRELVRDGRR